MQKDKYYRVTIESGRKFKGTFGGKLTIANQRCFRFFSHPNNQTVAIDLIEKIEEITITRSQTIAIEQGCFEEYKKYLTVNGKKIRDRHTYKEINFK